MSAGLPLAESAVDSRSHNFFFFSFRPQNVKPEARINGIRKSSFPPFSWERLCRNPRYYICDASAVKFPLVPNQYYICDASAVKFLLAPNLVRSNIHFNDLILEITDRKTIHSIEMRLEKGGEWITNARVCSYSKEDKSHFKRSPVEQHLAGFVMHCDAVKRHLAVSQINLLLLTNKSVRQWQGVFSDTSWLSQYLGTNDTWVLSLALLPSLCNKSFNTLCWSCSTIWKTKLQRTNVQMTSVCNSW